MLRFLEVKPSSTSGKAGWIRCCEVCRVCCVSTGRRSSLIGVMYTCLLVTSPSSLPSLECGTEGLSATVCRVSRQHWEVTPVGTNWVLIAQNSDTGHVTTKGNPGSQLLTFPLFSDVDAPSPKNPWKMQPHHPGVLTKETSSHSSRCRCSRGTRD